MNLANIPVQMRALAQWACANSDKRPFNPLSGLPAAVDDPCTCVSFDEAAAAVNSGRYKHAGFMLTGGIGFVDLDDKPHHPATEADKARFEKIIEHLDSYTEISAGGRSGRHVFVLTQSDLPNRRRGPVEIYFKERFAILTGDILGTRDQLVDRTDQLSALHGEMFDDISSEAQLVEIEAEEADNVLTERAMGASNGAKFRALWEGDWRRIEDEKVPAYPSASEADFALLSILCFYSASNEQVRRLFSASGMFRKKTTRRYIDRALKKIRASTPKVDLSVYLSTAGRNSSAMSQSSISAKLPIPMPPGKLGDLAQHFFDSAVMPIREVAVAGALAFAGGLCGRAFHINRVGLNVYITLIAPAGVGKEGARDGIEQMFGCVCSTVPLAKDLLGPERAASGQALHRHLSKSPAFVSIWDEFGLLFNQMEGPRTPPHLVELKRILLTCYTRSGPGKVLREAVYAQSENNTPMVQSPTMTLLGLTTREHFFDRLSLTNMSEGLLPRMSLIEFDGPRPIRNRHAGTLPPGSLIATCSTIAAMAVENLLKLKDWAVATLPDAQLVLDVFEEKCRLLADAELFGAQVMWARAAMKAMKFAALCAVFDNPSAPAVSKEHALWAVEFVTQEVELIVRHAKDGTLGAGEQLWEQSIRNAVEAFERMTPKQRRDHRVKDALAEAPYFEVNGHDELVVPLRIFMSYLRQRVPFKGAPQGETRAVRDAIKHATQLEVIALAPAEAQAKFGTKAELYMKARDW